MGSLLAHINVQFCIFLHGTCWFHLYAVIGEKNAKIAPKFMKID